LGQILPLDTWMVASLPASTPITPNRNTSEEPV
jgi:hypothetical protein